MSQAPSYISRVSKDQKALPFPKDAVSEDHGRLNHCGERLVKSSPTGSLQEEKDLHSCCLQSEVCSVNHFHGEAQEILSEHFGMENGSAGGCSENRPGRVEAFQAADQMMNVGPVEAVEEVGLVQDDPMKPGQIVMKGWVQIHAVKGLGRAEQKMRPQRPMLLLGD
jgi:hypothetical protein